MPYLDVAGFRGLTIAPTSYVDTVETDEPGWLLTQLGYWSAWLDARLAKRYAVPFDIASPPVAVTGWLARIVTQRLFLKRGYDPTAEQGALIAAEADAAIAEVKEAADSVAGLFELPLRADAATLGVAKGAPLAYTEQSPYSWSRVQRAAAADDP